MSAMTFQGFVETLAAVEVTGVSTRLDYPPASAPKLPCSFPMLPTGDERPMTIDGAGGWPTMRVDWVILYMPVAQSTPESNFADCLEMMDAISTALRTNRVGTAKITWALRQAVVTLAGIDYWAVVAAVEGRG